MAEAPEIPEAKDNYERFIALVIATLAVILAFVDTKGSNAQADGIVSTSKAANQWAYFQSKSLKENLAESNATLLSLLTPVDAAKAKAVQDKMEAEVKRYEADKTKIKADAEQLEKDADFSMSINDRCDSAALFLQIAVVVCSISILVRWKAIFIAGLTVGAVGIYVSITALMM